MAYATATTVRVVCGLSTSDISDADLTSIIVYADNRIDTEPHVSLSTAQKEQASNFLSASMALHRLAAATSASPGSYSIGSLRVDNRSAVAIRIALAHDFMLRYTEIIELNRSGGDIDQFSN